MQICRNVVLSLLPDWSEQVPCQILLDDTVSYVTIILEITHLFHRTAVPKYTTVEGSDRRKQNKQLKTLRKLPLPST